MPTFKDQDGTLYWFDTVPPEGIVRSDLVLVPQEEDAPTGTPSELPDETPTAP